MLNSWKFQSKTRVCFGKNHLDALLELDHGEVLLLISAPIFSRNGTVEHIIKGLAESKITVFDEDIVNPSIDFLDNLREKFRNVSFSEIIALGGGSVLDTAKVLSATMSCNANNILSAYFRKGIDIVFQEPIPVIAIPTTAGTGAECTPFATVWDAMNKNKYSLESETLAPSVIILDPELSLELPHNQTLYSGLDALSHAVESLWNKHSNPISAMFAKEALAHIVISLPKLLDDLHCVKHRSAMLYASFCSGMAISQTKTAIAHAISYPLSYKHGIPHGLASSFSIPALFRYLLSCRKLDEEICSCIGNAVVIIEQLPVQERLSSFTNRADILSLLSEMNNPKRFNNFLVLPDQTDLRAILMEATKGMRP